MSEAKDEAGSEAGGGAEKPGAARLVALICTAQVLAQVGAYAWPALLPEFIPRWGLDYSEAGWITASFYLAYMLSVPILVTLTDRIDPRRVYMFGVGCTVIGHLLFALYAEGYWTATLARSIAGIGWAGTYMTGLKLLADRVEGKLLSRAVTWHAASMGVASALSFVFAGIIANLWDWHATFFVAAGGAAGAWLIAAIFAPKQAPRPAAPDSTSAWALFDFRPVFANRSAMAYSVGYCIHTWEMGAMRGWAVAFLAYVALQDYGQDYGPGGGETPFLGPTVMATAMALFGVWASVSGNELSIRLGRQRLVRLAMAGSMVFALAIGFLGAFSYPLAAVLLVLYGMVIWLDSSSLTAGAAGSAAPGRRGATLAVHSMLGYGGGFVGPIMVGWILDLAGGPSHMAWGLAFGHIALAMLAARIVFTWLRPDSLAGDRKT
ncbi:MAG: MFS transporter [Alphaproteobacteria bacterium]|nr:MFS transporter [Alphaproteobacteria bacterium]